MAFTRFAALRADNPKRLKINHAESKLIRLDLTATRYWGEYQTWCCTTHHRLRTIN